jgi:gamma-glutamylaminecyclotransferase
MSALVFVYGTLKRGCCNHPQLADQTFVAEAETAPAYALHEVGGFPGLVPCPDGGTAVRGEVWSVEAAALARLDRFEGLAEGLYRRERVVLAGPLAGEIVEAYLYARDVTRRPVVGAEWREGPA